MTESRNRSAADAGITIEANPNRVIVRLDADYSTLRPAALTHLSQARCRS
jgi:hypothetical protein